MATPDLADKVALLTEAIREEAHPARTDPLYGPIIVRAEAACKALVLENTPPVDAARIALAEAIRELMAIKHDAEEAQSLDRDDFR
ncbi:MAG: hypothetical protein JOY71_24880 [Acetobacteraceae bacterium]|nr:hypothetical protein [Acetobacteraceae bacterium]MBV8525316.1 hypothetical protein [Acetobacteraceae bacterium]